MIGLCVLVSGGKFHPWVFSPSEAESAVSRFLFFFQRVLRLKNAGVALLARIAPERKPGFRSGATFDLGDGVAVMPHDLRMSVRR